LNVYAL